jgi:hypothetical protein
MTENGNKAKEKDKDKLLAEKEKLEAEIARSLSVVKMKETHKQIEDIERSRKKAAIQSIITRIDLSTKLNESYRIGFQQALAENKNAHPQFDFNRQITNSRLSRLLETVAATYESIYFDIQRNIDVGKDDFSKLFPKLQNDFSTLDILNSTLMFINCQLFDMKAYCLRLL